MILNSFRRIALAHSLLPATVSDRPAADRDETAGGAGPYAGDYSARFVPTAARTTEPHVRDDQA